MSRLSNNGPGKCWHRDSGRLVDGNLFLRLAFAASPLFFFSSRNHAKERRVVNYVAAS
jgi:hypothetical protein